MSITVLVDRSCGFPELTGSIYLNILDSLGDRDPLHGGFATKLLIFESLLNDLRGDKKLGSFEHEHLFIKT